MAKEIIATCYIHRAGDESNRCFLTFNALVIHLKGKEHKFTLDLLNSIRFSTKKMWLPLVIGGILASLSTVAFFKGIGNPWFILILLLSGLFLFYYGNQGTQIMTITSGNDPTHFFLGKVTPNLKAFMTFVQNYIHPKESMRHLFLILDRSVLGTVTASGIQPGMMGESHRIKCLTIQQFQKVKKNKEEGTLEIDPIKVNSEIRYEWDEHQHDLFPYVYGPIPPEAII